MIYYSEDKINDWNYADDNIIKVYRHNAVCYYKVVSGGSHQEPCYAVVDDIEQYSSTEFVDVFDKATEKWYKLNNLNEFEEYGIYGNGTGITFYEGKLTIDGGYEYQYSGTGWTNVGEVTGATKTSGFTTPDINTSSPVNENVNDGDYVVISYYVGSSPTNPNTMLSYKNQAPYYASNLTDYLGTSSIDTSTTIDAAVWKIEAAPTSGQYFIKNANNGMYWAYQKASSSNSFNLENSPSPIAILPTNYTGFVGFVEKESGVASYYGGYGLNRLFGYSNMMNWFNSASYSAEGFWGDSNASFRIFKVDAGSVEYPVEYAEKQAPPQDLVFADMEEALAYECPYVGLLATIGGVEYIFANTNEWLQVLYQWVTIPGEYECDEGDKYSVEKEQVSYDGGITWSDTGQERQGSIIETGSTDCSHVLPSVEFSINYNAKEYNAGTYTIPQTNGQLQNVDAVCNTGYNIVDHSADGYITVNGSTRMIISGNNGTYLTRYNNLTGCSFTVVSKALTRGGYSVFTNRSGYERNYMYRQDTTYAYLCGTGNTGSNTCLCSPSDPNILSVRVYYDSSSNRYMAKWDNWTTNVSSNPVEYQFNPDYITDGGALFCDYSNMDSEFWQGDFYWIYMTQNTLTDEQIRQVIDYNENL